MSLTFIVLLTAVSVYFENPRLLLCGLLGYLLGKLI